MRKWLWWIVGAALVVVALASLDWHPDRGLAAPLAVSTAIIQDADTANRFDAGIVMGVAATPGAAGTPGIYEPVRTDGSGRMQVSANVVVPTVAVQAIQPNGAQAAQTPIAVFTPFVRVVGTLPPSDLTTPLPISGAAVAVSLTTPVPAGENVIGKVGGNTLHPSANPALTVAASYVTGDYVGTSSTPWSWTACRTATGTGQLQSVTVVDKALQSIAGEVWLFDRSVTVPLDSAAWTITDADAQFLLGVVPTGTYYASAANSVSVATGVGLTVWCNAGSLIYGAFVTRGSPTYASGDLTIILGISAD